MASARRIILPLLLVAVVVSAVAGIGVWRWLQRPVRHATTVTQSRLETTRFGAITLFTPESPGETVVILLSPSTGIDGATGGVALALARLGALVAAIDTSAYLRSLREEQGCLYLSGEFERLSQVIQNHAHLDRLSLPTIAGVGDGATLAYTIHAQNPSSFYALMTTSICTTFPLPLPLCPTENLATSWKEGVITVAPAKALPPRWMLVSTPTTTSCAAIPPQIWEERESPGGGLRVVRSRQVNWYDSNAFADGYHVAVEQYQETPYGEMFDLPLVVVEGRNSRQPFFMILISGDGGWATIDKEVASYLADRGISIVGIDALRYFWHERTPHETAEDVNRIITAYSDKWGIDAVVLAGYSFGADVVPPVYRELPAETRARVLALSLLNPSLRSTFEIDLNDWISSSSDKGAELLPVLRSITAPITCIYGSDESESLCRQPDMGTNIVVSPLPGTHHFNGDYTRVAQTMIEGLKGLTTRDSDLP